MSRSDCQWFFVQLYDRKATFAADIQITLAIIDVVKPLGIAVYGHILVGKKGHASFNQLRLI